MFHKRVIAFNFMSAKCNVNLWKGRLGLVNIHHEGGGEGLVG